jgi:glycosyltransferase involved in cell wall biosynthesis
VARVSFIVPCYRLAHLLGECVDSILSQTFQDFEILIMDDCSPDETPAVAASFSDPRVRYVRNEPNLGHLRNYNKGIALASGDYLWLISADDRLRRPYVLERFVQTLDAHPDAGYVFCPAMKFEGAADTVAFGDQGPADRVFAGHAFLRTLANGNAVPAPSGMVRRSCYERISVFPLDLPFAADWFLFSIFALWTNVAYLAEPMVSYRVHTGNMTLDFKQRADALIDDELKVLWRMKARAIAAGMNDVARLYADALAWSYATRVAFKVSRDWLYGMSVDAFEHSLDQHCETGEDAAAIRSRTYAFLADQYHELGNAASARQWYRAALSRRPADVTTAVKLVLASTGSLGRRVRELAHP